MLGEGEGEPWKIRGLADDDDGDEDEGWWWWWWPEPRACLVCHCLGAAHGGVVDELELEGPIRVRGCGQGGRGVHLDQPGLQGVIHVMSYP